MDQLFQLFQFIEIFLFIKKVLIKFNHQHKNILQVIQLKLLVGMKLTERIVGLLKTVGEKIGVKMVLGKYFLI